MNPLTRYPAVAASFAIVVFAILGAPLLAQSLVISEFMASNQDTLDDEDGNSEDWIFGQTGDDILSCLLDRARNS